MTTFAVVKDRAYSTLASTLAIDGLSLAVAAGEGARFPSTFPFYVSLNTEANREIVQVTNRVSDTLTITRAQCGTSAAAHSAGVAVSLNLLAQHILDLNSATNALETQADSFTRSATITIAAVDASAAELAAADILCDGTNDDVELLAAHAALPANGGVIVLSTGTFTCRAGYLIFTKPTILTGQGAGRKDTSAGQQPTVLVFTGTGICLDLTYYSSSVEHLQITALDANISRVIRLGGAWSKLFDISIIGGDAATDGVLLNNALYCTLTDILVSGCGTGLALAGITSGLTLLNVNLNGNNTAGFDFGGDGGTSANDVFISLYLQSNAIGLICGSGGYYGTFLNAYFEGNTTDIQFASGITRGHIFINPSYLTWSKITDWDNTTTLITGGKDTKMAIFKAGGTQVEIANPGALMCNVMGSRNRLFLPAMLLGIENGSPALVADATAMLGTSFKLNAQSQQISHFFTLPAPGKYIAFARVRDTNQVAGDVVFEVRNITDGGAIASSGLVTATASWANMALLRFTIPESYVGDKLRVWVYKYTATANEIYVDFVAIEPDYSQNVSDLFMDVLAVSANAIRSNEDLSESIPNTFTLDAQPDVPRTLSGHFDSHAQISAYSITITGIDGRGEAVSETKTEADGWDWETNNAFAKITSIIMTARTGTGAGDTMDIGITDVLGLSNLPYQASDVYKIKKNNANATVVSGDVNVTYGTYDMATITLGAGDDFTIWYKSAQNIR